MKFIKLNRNQFESIIIDNTGLEPLRVETAVEAVLSEKDEIRQIKDNLSFQKFEDIALMVVLVMSKAITTKQNTKAKEDNMANENTNAQTQESQQKPGKGKKALNILKIIGIFSAGAVGGYGAAQIVGKKSGK